MLNQERKVNEVLVQDMDPHLISICPDAEYLLQIEGWEFENGGHGEQGHGMMRNGIGWFDRTHYPEEFVRYVDQLGFCQISGFADGGVVQPKGLNWHIDAYWVYSWNVEGNTTWHWFDMRDGTMHQASIGEMDKVMMMPPGTPHMVTIESECRTSLSIVRPGHWDDIENHSRRRDCPVDYKGVN